MSHASRCWRAEPRFDPERGWAKPNGTIGCDNPEHGVNEPAQGDLGDTEEWVTWNVDHAPPLSPAQRDRLAVLLNPGSGQR
jgi:hypothetical protein